METKLVFRFLETLCSEALFLFLTVFLEKVFDFVLEVLAFLVFNGLLLVFLGVLMTFFAFLVVVNGSLGFF